MVGNSEVNRKLAHPSRKRFQVFVDNTVTTLVYYACEVVCLAFVRTFFQSKCLFGRFLCLASALRGPLVLALLNTWSGAFDRCANLFRINTSKSVSKQRTLTAFRMNTYEKEGEGGPVTVN